MGVFIRNYSKEDLIKKLYYGLKPEHIDLLSKLDLVNLTTDVLRDIEEAYLEGFNQGYVKSQKDQGGEKGMKFKELLEIIDPDTYVSINDIEHISNIECDADNSFLQFLSELTVEKIDATGTLSIDLSQKRIEE